MKRLLFVGIAALNLLLLDQFVKKVAECFWDASPISLPGGFLNLVCVRNRGCAWGMLQGSAIPLALFGAVALAVLMWKRRLFFRAGLWGTVVETIAYAGIAGNLIDRIVRGFVVDMFDFHFHGWHFPAFNVADVCISLAAFMLVCEAFFFREK